MTKDNILGSAFKIIDDSLGPTVETATDVVTKGVPAILDPEAFDLTFGSVHGGSNSVAEQLKHRQEKKAQQGKNVSLTEDEETGLSVDKMPLPDAKASVMEAPIKPSEQKKRGYNPGPSKYHLDGIRKAGEVTGADRAMAFFQSLGGNPISATAIAQNRQARALNLFNQEQAARNKQLEEQAIRERQNPNSDYNKNFRNVVKGLYADLGLPMEVKDTMTADDLPFAKDVFEQAMRKKVLQMEDQQWYEHKNAEAQQKLALDQIKREKDREDYVFETTFATDEKTRGAKDRLPIDIAKYYLMGGGKNLKKAMGLAKTGEVPGGSYVAGSGQTPETEGQIASEIIMFSADSVNMDEKSRDRLQNIQTQLANLVDQGKVGSTIFRKLISEGSRLINKYDSESDKFQQQVVPGVFAKPGAPELGRKEAETLRNQTEAFSFVDAELGRALDTLSKVSTGAMFVDALKQKAGIPLPLQKEIVAVQTAMDNLVPYIGELQNLGILQPGDVARIKSTLGTELTPHNIVNMKAKIRAMRAFIQRALNSKLEGKGRRLLKPGEKPQTFGDTTGNRDKELGVQSRAERRQSFDKPAMARFRDPKTGKYFKPIQFPNADAAKEFAAKKGVELTNWDPLK